MKYRTIYIFIVRELFIFTNSLKLKIWSKLSVSNIRNKFSYIQPFQSLFTSSTSPFIPTSSSSSSTALYSKSSSYFQSIDWLELCHQSINSFNQIKYNVSNLDFSSGAYTISLPENHYEEIEKLLNQSTKTITLFSFLPSSGTTTIQNITYVPQVTSIYRLHQFSKQILSKFPDSALIGVVVLSSLELIKRQIKNTDSLTYFNIGSTRFTLPPSFKEVANITTENLNSKLEILSSLSYDLTLFSKTEMDYLQTQPLENIEKYILKELLPKLGG